MEILRGFPDGFADAIYLDPPFNSKHDYSAPIGSKAAGAAFKDTWTLQDVDVAWWGEINEHNPGLYQLLLAAGTVGGDSAKSYLIYMSIRILEMHRILKDTGFICLHCDPAMSHYLKLAMDAVFGTSGYRNEIIWKRTHGRTIGGRKVGSVHDTLLLYGKTDAARLNAVALPHDPEQVSKTYPYKDEHGRYTSDQLTATGTRTGESGQPWRGVDPGARGNHWRGRGTFPPHIPKPLGYDSMSTHQKLDKLDELGLILWPKKKDGMPRFKLYLGATAGKAMTDTITDISPIASHSAERLGYPTQKPIKLLKRIIQLITDKGAVFLDPFCGCATACSAAEVLERQWIGIDISPKAYELVLDRLKREAGIEKWTKGAGEVIHRTDIPVRAGRRSKNIKHLLFGKQEGKCNLCKHQFEFRNMEVDHIIPKAKGGPDDDSNLQLLCGHCNKIKGDGTMAEARARLAELNIRVG